MPNGRNDRSGSASPVTVSALLQTYPGTNFYRDLQLVVTVARLEALACGLGPVPDVRRRFFPDIGNDPTKIESLRTLFLYGLLLLIDGADEIEVVRENLTELEPQHRGIFRLLHEVQAYGGSRVFRDIQRFLFSGGYSFSYIHHETGELVRVTENVALRALRTELRTQFLDPIFAIGAWLRDFTNGQPSCEERFGSSLAFPFERTELPGETGTDFGRPSTPVPYPAIRSLI